MLGVLSLVATDLSGIALPWLIKGGIDTALRAPDATRSLFHYPLLILGAAALQGFFRYCWRINIHGFSRRCEADLRDRVFAHLQKLPLSYFQYSKTGDLMSRLTNDIHAVRELMGFGSLAIVDAVVVIICSLALMITIDPWLTLWSMMAMPLIPIVVRYFGRQIFRVSHDTQEQLSALSAYVLENLSGIRVVQAYAQEHNQMRGFSAISSEYRRRTMWLATLWGIFWPLDAGHGRLRRNGGALARRPAGLARDHDLGRVRGLQRLSGHAHLAADGDRLHRQSISARHRGAVQIGGGSRHAAVAALRASERDGCRARIDCAAISNFAISISLTAKPSRRS